MEPKDLVSSILSEFESLPEFKAAPMREIRRRYSKTLGGKDPQYVFGMADLLLESGKYRWIAYELIREHQGAFQALDKEKLEDLGQGINSWSSVDSFSRTLSGPAWREGLISQETIHEWAQSDDRWWRRAALVSTVALNVRSRGGKGDVERTLAICERLAADDNDMVVKALSWALRELIVHDPNAVERFIIEHEDVLAARVLREVKNKIETGLKNP
jgi:3-methyladenine DNA glycosylase AlkD